MLGPSAGINARAAERRDIMSDRLVGRRLEATRSDSLCVGWDRRGTQELAAMTTALRVPSTMYSRSASAKAAVRAAPPSSPPTVSSAAPNSMHDELGVSARRGLGGAARWDNMPSAEGGARFSADQPGEGVRRTAEADVLSCSASACTSSAAPRPRGFGQHQPAGSLSVGLGAPGAVQACPWCRGMRERRRSLGHRVRESLPIQRPGCVPPSCRAALDGGERAADTGTPCSPHTPDNLSALEGRANKRGQRGLIRRAR